MGDFFILKIPLASWKIAHGEELTRLVTLVLFFLSLKRAVGAREGAVLYLRVPHNDGLGGERGNSILRETVQPLPCKTLQRKLSPSSWLVFKHMLKLLWEIVPNDIDSWCSTRLPVKQTSLVLVITKKA